ncbi:MAG TPA: hypothetical protein VK002_03935 [Rubricoccaceae bacterium]|nr:hypothetical protein [Rubricoccaceae bacterium]
MRLHLCLLAALALAACTPNSADGQTGPVEADTTRFEGVPPGEAVVAERLPITDAVLAEDPPGRALLRDYARRALFPQTIRTAAHLEEVFALRDSVIAHLDPRVEDYFVEEDYALVERFFAEAEAVGLEPLTAEGFVLGVGPGVLLPERVEALGAPDFQLFMAFRAAHARSLSGEYPYADMEPLRQAVLLGERLVYEHPESPHAAAVRDDFEGALLTFMSLHRHDGEWFVGPATTEFYPWASTDEAHRRFAAEDTGSRFHPAVAALLANPSEAGGEALDAVVFATGSDAYMRQHVLDALAEGIDALDVLPLDAGWTYYGAVYRYFPAGDARAAQAVEAARAKGLEAEVQTIPLPFPYEE